jgi:opacity protein-like surface antigen
MRKLLALAAVGTAALLGGQAIAADMPEYPPIDIPDVDYDVGGSFYLRGSAALNYHWAPEVVHPWDADDVDPIVNYGYGYSWGAGFGYETGTGLRFDGTIDSVETTGLMITKDGGDPDDGDYTLMLRSTVALANVYYDFGLGDMGGYSSGGGAFAYVGAGAGVAWNHAEINSPLGVPEPVPTGDNVSAAGALMAGVGYDMGSWVADVGYRGLYVAEINNSPTDEATSSYYEIHNNWIHEVRGTIRYRLD